VAAAPPAACTRCSVGGGAPVAKGPCERARRMEGDETEAVVRADVAAVAWSGGTAKQQGRPWS
jgi:hypothetical protein